jgi:GGDEF domain-containing protein|nr:hypothetical protein [Neorhizobium tomejilense]
MAFELDHDSARKLAKALMARTGREIKLKDIYTDIGSLFGMNGDAMMHALKKTRSGGGQATEDSHVDHVVGLETLPTLLDRLERDRSGSILFCVIHLGSLSGILDRFGDAAAIEHLMEFAALLRPNPSDLFRRRMSAYIGDSYFIVAWPTAMDDDHQWQANTPLRGWWLDLEKKREDRGLDEGYRYEFGGSADVLEAGRFNRKKILADIELMKVKAVNQLAARRHLKSFPVVRMVY